jgi:protein-tyrosine phosphatase
MPDLFWIPGPWAGKLAVSTRPRGGDWLEGEVSAWNNAGVDTIVSLLEPDEAAELGLAEEPAVVRAMGLQFRSLPIPDRGVPGSDIKIRRFLTDLILDLAKSRNIAVHCRQGVGRSGMVTAAALITSGASARDAVEIVSRARGLPVPETADQLRWLEKLSSEHPIPAASR